MKFDNQKVCVRDEATGKSREVATVQVISEATLDELREHFGDKKLVELALRQHTQDVANAARVDWKNGGLKAERQAKIDRLTASMTAGEIDAPTYAKEIAKLFGK